jgi:hypothetical protein
MSRASLKQKRNIVSFSLRIIVYIIINNPLI